MKAKLLNIGLIISSLLGYLEWGKNNHQFLFESEWYILSNIFSKPLSVLHPFTVIPLLGQLLLLITTFQEKPSKVLIYIGIACIGILLGFMFIIGLISQNFRILSSTIPFLIIAIFTIKSFRKS